MWSYTVSWIWISEWSERIVGSSSLKPWDDDLHWAVPFQEDEEEGGEDDDDDGFFVPHGYLSDDEGAVEEEVWYIFIQCISFCHVFLTGSRYVSSTIKYTCNLSGGWGPREAETTPETESKGVGWADVHQEEDEGTGAGGEGLRLGGGRTWFAAFPALRGVSGWALTEGRHQPQPTGAVAPVSERGAA